MVVRFMLVAWLVLIQSLVQASAYQPDWVELHESALLSAAAYLPADDTQLSVKPLGWTIETHNELAETAVQYYLASNSETQVLVVRGTANLENVLVDLDFQLKPHAALNIMLHQGFAEAAGAILNDARSKLDISKPIRTTGHSLGGAVAQILAMQLDALGFNVVNVITFGQPKVTNVAGVNAFEHIPLLRVVTPLDVVPLVPALSPMDVKNLDIYWHGGTELILMGQGKYAITGGLKSMLRATKFLNKVPDDTNAQAHEMQTYIALLAHTRAEAMQVPYKADLSIFGITID